jgi:hypothetical protein
MNKKLYLFLATAAAWLNAPPFQNLGFDQDYLCFILFSVENGQREIEESRNWLVFL